MYFRKVYFFFVKDTFRGKLKFCKILKLKSFSDEEEQTAKPLYFFDLIKKDSEEASVWNCKYS